MKNKLFPLFLLLLFPLAILAQENPLKIGLKAIPEFSKPIGPYSGDAAFVFGGGIQILYSLTPELSFASGLYCHYDSFGDDLSVGAGGNSTKVRYRHYTFSLPLDLRYSFKEFLYVTAGPRIEYFLGVKSIEKEGNKRIIIDYSGPEFGAGLTFGYEAPMLDIPNVNLFLEGRFSTVFAESFQPGQINYGLGIGLNYTFNN